MRRLIVTPNEEKDGVESLQFEGVKNVIIRRVAPDRLAILLGTAEVCVETAQGNSVFFRIVDGMFPDGKE